MALTLLLVGPAVIVRLDDVFLQQEQLNLESRTNSTRAFVALLLDVETGGSVVTPDNHATQVAQGVLKSPIIQVIADEVAQADLVIRVGSPTENAGEWTLVPAEDGTVAVKLQKPPQQGQAVEPISGSPGSYRSASPFRQWAMDVTLANPYTYRQSTLAAVTGLFLGVGIVAFLVSVAIAAFLARRFTTPLRRLTAAASDLERGELGSRVPTRLEATGAMEISDLSRRFNSMADRLEESVAIIRRDRDRSRDFLADVSHELRTPIAALRTFNELLSEAAGDDPETRGEFLESSRQQLERLDWLAQNLLDLSKLDSGLVLLDLRPDDLRTAVEYAHEQAEPAAARRGISLTVSVPDRPVRIRHDPQRIGQVVSNLVGNALKFTPKGGTVAIELRATPSGARIEVRDTGVGIDASELPRIFDRFYRGSLMNEARGSGSGLGLSIAKSIVDLHAGRISVESRLGVGTTFVVTLPKDPRRAAAEGSAGEGSAVERDGSGSAPVDPLPPVEVLDSSPSARS